MMPRQIGQTPARGGNKNVVVHDINRLLWCGKMADGGGEQRACRRATRLQWMAAKLYARGSILALLLGSIRRNVLATMTQPQPQQPRTGPGFAGRWGGRHGSLGGASPAPQEGVAMDETMHACTFLAHTRNKMEKSMCAGHCCTVHTNDDDDNNNNKDARQQSSSK